MKVAVSIPDDVFTAAERASRRLRVPRSQFYARALEAYVRAQERPDVTARLDAVYGDRDAGDEEAALVAEGSRTLAESEWKP